MNRNSNHETRINLQQFQIINREALKCIAIILMLLDHAYMTVVNCAGFQWMTMLGRLAFPIFAFQIVEGYMHTGSKKKYIQHMFLFALISEIPYNLMMGGTLIGPFHQNVMFTFFIALLLLAVLERIYESGLSVGVKILLVALVCLLGIVIGTITFVDYSGFGVLTVLIFYIANRMPKWYMRVITQVLGLWIINGIFLGGKIIILANGFEFPEQGLAMFSLLLIWAYNGKKRLTGKTAQAFKYGMYLFYPLHILILSMIALYGL